MEREQIAYEIAIFESVLANGEAEEIEEARENMKKVIESFGYI